MAPWETEIIELHKFFEGYFLGTLEQGDLQRLEDALAEDFTFLGPDGSIATRAQTVAAIENGHDHTNSLTITVTNAVLLAETEELVVARYVENHELTGASNHRLSTVVFRRDPNGPNGFRWLTTHETWMAGTRD